MSARPSSIGKFQGRGEGGGRESTSISFRLLAESSFFSFLWLVGLHELRFSRETKPIRDIRDFITRNWLMQPWMLRSPRIYRWQAGAPRELIVEVSVQVLSLKSGEQCPRSKTVRKKERFFLLCFFVLCRPSMGWLRSFKLDRTICFSPYTN